MEIRQKNKKPIHVPQIEDVRFWWLLKVWSSDFVAKGVADVPLFETIFNWQKKSTSFKNLQNF